MKRFIYASISIAFFICTLGFVTLFFWIEQDVDNNIQLAEYLYKTDGEDALISYLEDEKNSYYSRSHLAIWTLGKIRSQKALPVLKKYYLNDPEGRSCKGMHHDRLCQYEINKAIKAIETGSLFSYSSLK